MISSIIVACQCHVIKFICGKTLKNKRGFHSDAIEEAFWFTEQIQNNFFPI